MSLSLQSSQHMPELNTQNVAYRSTFLRTNVCETIRQFAKYSKDAHKKIGSFFLPSGIQGG